MKTSLICKLLHPVFGIITTDIFLDDKWVEYPDICYRCDPDEYTEKHTELEARIESYRIKSLKEAEEYYKQCVEKSKE